MIHFRGVGIRQQALSKGEGNEHCSLGKEQELDDPHSHRRGDHAGRGHRNGPLLTGLD